MRFSCFNKTLAKQGKREKHFCRKVTTKKAPKTKEGAKCDLGISPLLLSIFFTLFRFFLRFKIFFKTLVRRETSPQNEATKNWKYGSLALEHKKTLHIYIAHLRLHDIFFLWNNTNVNEIEFMLIKINDLKKIWILLMLIIK